MTRSAAFSLGIFFSDLENPITGGILGKWVAPRNWHRPRCDVETPTHSSHCFGMKNVPAVSMPQSSFARCAQIRYHLSIDNKKSGRGILTLDAESVTTGCASKSSGFPV